MNKLLLSTLLLICITSLRCSDKSTILSAIKDGEKLEQGTLIEFLLHQNNPNPFNPTTSILYEVYTLIHLQMKIFTEDWQEVRTLFDKEHNPGHYSVYFNGKNSKNEYLPSGEYFYTLEGNGLTLIRRMKIVK